MNLSWASRLPKIHYLLAFFFFFFLQLDVTSEMQAKCKQIAKRFFAVICNQRNVTNFYEDVYVDTVCRIVIDLLHSKVEVTL